VSRRAALPALALTVTIGAVLLGGCGNGDGLALARQACSHVAASIRYYNQAQRTTDVRQAANDLQQATDQLSAALPLAARANSDDGNWNDLMTSIQEMGRVDEGHLIPALRSACVNVKNGTPGLPVSPPSNLPPEPGEPRTTTTPPSSTTTVSSTTAGTPPGASG
jgi:hypothetical protein